MSEAPKRRNLLALAAAPSGQLSQDAIAAVAARNGFSAATAARASEAVAEAYQRRRRQPTGRDHQFNVRLRRDTLDFIYAQANERNIPVAQVIEEAMEALKQRQR